MKSRNIKKIKLINSKWFYFEFALDCMFGVFFGAVGVIIILSDYENYNYANPLIGRVGWLFKHILGGAFILIMCLKIFDWIYLLIKFKDSFIVTNRGGEVTFLDKNFSTSFLKQEVRIIEIYSKLGRSGVPGYVYRLTIGKNKAKLILYDCDLTEYYDLIINPNTIIIEQEVLFPVFKAKFGRL